MRKFFRDCDGGIITTELVLVASFVTGALVTGLATLKSNVESEFGSLSDTIHSVKTVNQPIAPQATGSKIEPGFPIGTQVSGDFESWKDDRSWKDELRTAN